MRPLCTRVSVEGPRIRIRVRVLTRVVTRVRAARVVRVGRIMDHRGRVRVWVSSVVRVRVWVRVRVIVRLIVLRLGLVRVKVRVTSGRC